MKWKRSFMTPLLALVACLFMVSAGWARVTQFRAAVTPTVVQKGGDVYVSVELLNSDGQIDPAGYQEVEELDVLLSSTLGTVSTYNSTVSANDKGVKIVKINYANAPAGTDLITVTVKEYVYNDQGNLISRIIGESARLQVQVTARENTAKSIKVESIALPHDPIESEAGHFTDGVCNAVTNSTGEGCVVEAGDSFNLTLKACTQDINNDNTDCTQAENQNSDVTVWLVSNPFSPLAKIYELNGTFEHGVATINVPEETVTKAGTYYIYASAPSVYKNTITGEYEATEKFNSTSTTPIYKFIVSPRQATTVKVMANSAVKDLDQNGNFWCANNTGSDLYFYLADQYGNVADTQTGLPTSSSNGYVKVKICNSATCFTTSEFGYQGTVGQTYALKCSDFNFPTLTDNGTREERSLALSLVTSGSAPDVQLDNSSINLYQYANNFELDGTAFTETNFAGMGSGAFNNGTLTQIISSVTMNNGTGSSGTDLINDLGTGSSEKALQVHLQFYNGTTLLDDVLVSMGNQTTNSSGDEVPSNGTIATYELSLDNITKSFDKVCLYSSSTNKYLPKKCADISLDLRDLAKAKDVKFYKLRSKRYVYGLFGDTRTELNSVTVVGGSSSATLTLGAFNGTAADSPDEWYAIDTTDNATLFGEYTARVVDSLDNFANSSALSISCTHGEESGTNDTVTITWNDRTITEDTCTLSAGSLEPKQIPVTINWAEGIDHIDIDVPFDHVLTLSVMPVTITLKKSDGSTYIYNGNGASYRLSISDPSLIQVANSTSFSTTDTISHGETLDGVQFTNGVATIFVKTFASAGDVTITIANDAGTISGSASLNIVNSVGEIPVTVGSVTASPTSVSIANSETSTITVAVRDSGGSELAGMEVSAQSDNTEIASVSPSSCTTDENGNCQFTVTGGNTPGTAHITFTAQSQSVLVDVTVEQAECDADHLSLCTTEEACTGAGGYWYNDACNAQPQPEVKPAPTEPTSEELSGNEIANAPVQVGDVATGGDTMKLEVNFPEYESAVDIYVAIVLPDGSLYLLNSDKQLVTDLVPYQTNTTGPVTATVFDDFAVCTPFGAAIPEGQYTAISLVVPTGADIMTVDWANDPYELMYYNFDVQCNLLQ